MTDMCAILAQTPRILAGAVSAGQQNLKLNFRQRVGHKCWHGEFAATADNLRNAAPAADRTINDTSPARSGTKKTGSANAKIAFLVGVVSVGKANREKGFLKSSGGLATTRVCAVVVTSGGA